MLKLGLILNEERNQKLHASGKSRERHLDFPVKLEVNHSILVRWTGVSPSLPRILSVLSQRSAPIPERVLEYSISGAMSDEEKRTQMAKLVEVGKMVEAVAFAGQAFGLQFDRGKASSAGSSIFDVWKRLRESAIERYGLVITWK